MSRGYLARSAGAIADPLTRGAAWVTLWESMLDGAVPATTFVDSAIAAVTAESDEQSRARILTYVSGAWWRYLSDGERTERAANAEKVLRGGLDSAATASQKAAWFGALRRIATTPATLAWLTGVWDKSETVAGLPLAETDYSALALDLAVREVPGWSKILDGQVARIDNPDRKARFQFIMPALSADAAVRERWFLSLREVGNRRREPWVLDGLDYLHHPLRAAASAKYVRPSLDLLWEIQKTGDIFFPKRWLDATLGGHSSKEVADTVRDFLKGLPPNYPDRLRNITLQSADELYRAADITKK
jgi:aminopeptidase N